MKGLLDRLLRSKPAASDRPLIIEAAGRRVTITLKQHQRARRMTLRMARQGDAAVMTLPKRVGRAEAEAFALRSSPWIAKQLARRGDQIAFCAGTCVPLRGETHTITATGPSRGLIRHQAEARCIAVPGQPQHVARRLTEWLKREAHADLARASQHYAEKMGVSYRKLSVRDQKSRWGSCSAQRDLSYSWRLILAPPYVLDYVAAHEVAHLREMNHGPRFWRLVLTHCPHARDAKSWLKQHGSSLHRYG